MDNSTRFRLGKMLGLLGSDSDGEVLAAARAIKRLLETQGLTFGDLVNLVHAPVASSAPVVLRGDPDLVLMAESILRNALMLKAHELKFVRDVKARARIDHFYMTPKQANWFSYLYARYGDI
jgi:hypothetical protein